MRTTVIECLGVCSLTLYFEWYPSSTFATTAYQRILFDLLWCGGVKTLLLCHNHKNAGRIAAAEQPLLLALVNANRSDDIEAQQQRGVTPIGLKIFVVLPSGAFQQAHKAG